MRKIILLVALFFITLTNLFSFDANLVLNSNNLNINDNLYLRIEISDPSNSKNIKLKDIDGIDNFEIISTGNSQSFSSKYVVINGKLEKSSKQVYYIDIVLRAKKTGKFVIGPAELSSSTNKKLTNFLEVNVTGKKIISDKDDYLKINFGSKNINNNIINNTFLNKNNILKFIIVFILIIIIILVIFSSRNNKNTP